MYQYLNDVQKKRLFNVIFIALIFLALFLAVETLNALKESKYIGQGSYATNVISVSGKGEITTKADTGLFSFSIIEEGKSTKEAQDKVSKKETAILAALKTLGIPEKDIKTDSYNSYPKYEYSRMEVCTAGYCPPGKQTISGYEASQSITVKVRSTSDAGVVLAKVGELGASNISGLTFTIDDIDSVNAEARDAAIKDAKEKAQVLAKSLGIKLRKIVNFQEGGSYPVMYASGLMKSDAMAIPEAAPVPQLPTGENKITSNVTITYEVE